MTEFKVGDRLRNIHAASYPPATVTEITEEGFKYEFDYPWTLGPRLGTSTGGESYTDEGWVVLPATPPITEVADQNPVVNEAESVNEERNLADQAGKPIKINSLSPTNHAINTSNYADVWLELLLSLNGGEATISEAAIRAHCGIQAAMIVTRSVNPDRSVTLRLSGCPIHNTQDTKTALRGHNPERGLNSPASLSASSESSAAKEAAREIVETDEANLFEFNPSDRMRQIESKPSQPYRRSRERQPTRNYPTSL